MVLLSDSDLSFYKLYLFYFILKERPAINSDIDFDVNESCKWVLLQAVFVYRFLQY